MRSFAAFKDNSPIRNSRKEGYPRVFWNALAAPQRQTASKTTITTTTIAMLGRAAVQPVRIKGRTASMAHVMGFRRASHDIHHGIAVNGTKAVLRKIIGSDRNPSIEKKSP